ncbi:PREDICTED: aspartic proteinase CDR1-like [Tarenaya hassleriana]|uniref:aspartic proteinase CDR1-like n=1 Tax=Tarenaya hassleriana TaxID=28532 RepID=UPI00053C86A7|nr:PREDICTED: aspartic proteinase CDR1-like [Tarenaya hassleriana]
MASLFSSTLFSLFLLSSLFLSNANAEPERGFTVDLIHRDSPRSPFYNPAEVPSQRLRNALRRSMNRAVRFTNSFGPSPNTPQADITSSKGEYLMNVSIGSPPFPIMAIADTGSDLIWMQCKPCEDCYSQKAPIFDPKSSSTYKKVSCTARQCQAVDQTSCSSGRGGLNNGTCQYSIVYGDQSHSNGDVAVDTLTLGSTDGRPVALPNTVIGCGHDNAGTFDDKGSGLIGLGGGSVSLITQLGNSIGGKFSYCLVPLSSKSDLTSKMNFGSKAIVSGTGTVSTPLVKKDPDTFYYMTLEAITVGGKRLDFPGSKEEGNMIIDSGTTLTLLPPDFHSKLETAVAAVVKGKRVSDPGNFLTLCYQMSSDLKVPTITINFKGADVKLDPSNYFIQVADDVVCFAFGETDDFAIYGNLSQMNFLIGYDTVSKKMSFKPADCTKM